MNSKEVYSQENWQEVFRSSLSYGGNYHNAEDDTQEAFMTLWVRENLAPGKVEKPIAYNKRITRRLVCQRNRSAQKRCDLELEKIAILNTDPLTSLITKEKRTLRAKAVDTIKTQDSKETKDSGPKGRQVRVAQLYKIGLNIAEIASQLDIPEGTVKSDLARYRERRRKLPEVADYINYLNS